MGLEEDEQVKCDGLLIAGKALSEMKKYDMFFVPSKQLIFVYNFFQLL